MCDRLYGMIEAIQKNNEDQTFKSLDLSHKSLEGHSFVQCHFQNCNFTESLWRSAKFNNCIFSECNLSMVKLEGCRLHEIKFNGCKIVGAEFYKCEKTFFSAIFKDTLLHYCNFSELNLKNGSFGGCKVRECYFTATCLQAVKFADTDLTGTTFHNCDLIKADFSTAKHYDIDPRTNTIKKAKFSLPEAVGLLRGFDITLV